MSVDQYIAWWQNPVTRELINEVREELRKAREKYENTEFAALEESKAAQTEVRVRKHFCAFVAKRIANRLQDDPESRRTWKDFINRIEGGD